MIYDCPFGCHVVLMWAPVSACVSVAPWCMYRRIVLAKCCCDGRCARLKAAPCRACVSSLYHRDMETATSERRRRRCEDACPLQLAIQHTMARCSVRCCLSESSL